MDENARKKIEIWLLVLGFVLSLMLFYGMSCAESLVCFFNGVIVNVWNLVNSVFFQTVVVAIGVWFAYISIKREIKIKKRLDINEKIITYKAAINTSYYEIATLGRDAILRKGQKVSGIISSFHNRFDSFYGFFES